MKIRWSLFLTLMLETLWKTFDPLALSYLQEKEFGTNCYQKITFSPDAMSHKWIKKVSQHDRSHEAGGSTNVSKLFFH